MHYLALVAAIILASVPAQPASATGYGTATMTDNDPRELRLNAFQKYLEGDLPGATELYTQAIIAGEAQYGKNSSFVADLCYEVGTIALEDGQFQNAESFLSQAVKRKPNSVMARVKYADLLTMRGQQDKAFNQIQEALKISPGSPIGQQAMVKWMMSQASHRTAEGAIANVAATWECFRLRAMGQNSVQATIANISSWRNSFIRPKAKPQPKPVVAVSAPPKETPKAKPVPPVVSKPKVAKVKPVAKPVTAIKPKRVEKPVEAVAKAPEKPRMEKPPVEKHVVATTAAPSKKSRNGLVPPPPPGPVFGFGMVPPPPSNSFGVATLNTIATVKEKEKPKEKKPKPAPAAEPANEEDPDYLLKWASDGDKKKKH